ncbi:MAG: hypothetical protein GY835_22400 [bacterium]|nr:hypothetical protein [bacterium]
MPLILQTVYVSTGPRRELVKIEAQGFTIELAETIQRPTEEPFTYRDPHLGFGFRVPARAPMVPRPATSIGTRIRSSRSTNHP